MKVTIKKIGNSAYLTLPEAVLVQLNLAVGDLIDIALEEGRLVLSATSSHPRVAWEEAAQELAARGENGDVWPPFSNLGDESL